MRNAFDDECVLVQAGYEFCQRNKISPKECYVPQNNYFFNGGGLGLVNTSRDDSNETELSYISDRGSKISRYSRESTIQKDDTNESFLTSLQYEKEKENKEDMIAFAERICVDAFEKENDNINDKNESIQLKNEDIKLEVNEQNSVIEWSEFQPKLRSYTISSPQNKHVVWDDDFPTKQNDKKRSYTVCESNTSPSCFGSFFSSTFDASMSSIDVFDSKEEPKKGVFAVSRKKWSSYDSSHSETQRDSIDSRTPLLSRSNFTAAGKRSLFKNKKKKVAKRDYHETDCLVNSESNEKLMGNEKKNNGRLEKISKHFRVLGIAKNNNKNDEKRTRSKTCIDLNESNRTIRSKSMSDCEHTKVNDKHAALYTHLRDVRRNAVFEQSADERFGLSLCLKDYLVNKHLDTFF